MTDTFVIENFEFTATFLPKLDTPGAKATRLAVHTHDRLTKFCEKTLGKPLSHFIDSWTH